MKDTINFFIVGYPRSGTTLTASLVSRHSKVYIPAETHYFRNFVQQTNGTSTSEVLYEYFINNTRLKDLNIPNEILKGIIEDNFPNKPEILASTLNYLARKNNKQVIGEKTPGHILNYKTIVSAYPDTKFIIVMRDGRDCVLSNIKEKWTYRNPKKHAAEWNYYIAHYNDLISKYPDKAIIVKYENLIENPEQEIKKIMEFIGLEYEDSQLTESKCASVIPQWENEWKAKANTPPDKTNKYKWKKNKNRKLMAVLTLIMYKNLKAYGYECKAHPPINRFILYMYTFRNLIYTYKIYPILKTIATLTPYYRIKKIFMPHNIS